MGTTRASITVNEPGAVGTASSATATVPAAPRYTPSRHAGRPIDRLIRVLSAAILVVTGGFAQGASTSAADRYITVYAGKYTDHKLLEVFTDHPVPYEHSYAVAAAVAQVFSTPSPARQWETEWQVVKHAGIQTHWEFNAVLIHRWTRFPWNRWVRTSLAIGDGLSYATAVPRLELESPTNEGAARLLNYLVLELGLAPPEAQRWSVIGRIHHRSGVYGLFGDVDGGSNIMSLGVKYRY